MRELLHSILRGVFAKPFISQKKREVTRWCCKLFMFWFESVCSSAFEFAQSQQRKTVATQWNDKLTDDILIRSTNHVFVASAYHRRKKPHLLHNLSSIGDGIPRRTKKKLDSTTRVKHNSFDVRSNFADNKSHSINISPFFFSLAKISVTK